MSKFLYEIEAISRYKMSYQRTLLDSLKAENDYLKKHHNGFKDDIKKLSSKFKTATDLVSRKLEEDKETRNENSWLRQPIIEKERIIVAYKINQRDLNDQLTLEIAEVKKMQRQLLV